MVLGCALAGAGSTRGGQPAPLESLAALTHCQSEETPSTTFWIMQPAWKAEMTKVCRGTRSDRNLKALRSRFRKRAWSRSDGARGRRSVNELPWKPSTMRWAPGLRKRPEATMTSSKRLSSTVHPEHLLTGVLKRMWSSTRKARVFVEVGPDSLAVPDAVDTRPAAKVGERWSSPGSIRDASPAHAAARGEAARHVPGRRGVHRSRRTRSRRTDLQRVLRGHVPAGRLR